MASFASRQRIRECSQRSAFGQATLPSWAAPVVTGGSANPLSAAGAWAEPLPVIVGNVRIGTIVPAKWRTWNPEIGPVLLEELLEGRCRRREIAADDCGSGAVALALLLQGKGSPESAATANDQCRLRDAKRGALRIVLVCKNTGRGRVGPAAIAIDESAASRRPQVARLPKPELAINDCIVCPRLHSPRCNSV